MERSRKLRASRWIWLGLACAFVVLTGLREGVLGEDWTPDLNRYFWSATRRVESSHSRGSFGSSPPRYTEGVACTAHCDSPSDVCEAALVALGCNSEEAATAPLDIWLGEVSDPFCYTPVFKMATVHFSARASLALAGPGGNTAGNATISGELTTTITGIASCREFRRRVGRRIGELTRERLHESLSH